MRPLLLLISALFLTGCSASGTSAVLADASEGQNSLSWVQDVPSGGWSVSQSESDWTLRGELCGTIQATLIRGENYEIEVTPMAAATTECSAAQAEARAWIEELLAEEDASWGFDRTLLTVWTDSKLLAFEVGESF